MHSHGIHGHTYDVQVALLDLQSPRWEFGDKASPEAPMLEPIPFKKLPISETKSAVNSSFSLP